MMALAFLLGAAVLLVPAAMASMWWLRRPCACGRARWRCDASRMGCWRGRRSGTRAHVADSPALRPDSTGLPVEAKAWRRRAQREDAEAADLEAVAQGGADV